MENELVYECIIIPLNTEKKKEIFEAGANPNATNGDETVLSEIIIGYSHEYPTNDLTNNNCGEDDTAKAQYSKISDYDGRYLPCIVKLFIEYGCDCNNPDFNGFRCLINLTWASYDNYILDAARLLLDFGANPNYDDGECSLLSWVYTKESAARCFDEDKEQEKLFLDYGELLEHYGAKVDLKDSCTI